VARLSDRFRNGAQKLGFDTHHSQTQIVPLITGTEQSALDLSRHLRDRGFWVTAIRPPTVAKGTSRLRFALNFGQNNDDIDRCLDSIDEWCRKSGTHS
jgi:8-amino-7-oxononanoate synthase